MRPVTAETRYECRVIVEGSESAHPTLAFEFVSSENLVPIVAHTATSPAIPTSARQPHRVGLCCAEVRLGRRGAPVDEELIALRVQDVRRLVCFGIDDVAET